MESVSFYFIGYYASFCLLGILIIGVLPAHIMKRIKADNLRDAHHQEIMIVLSIVLILSTFIINIMLDPG